MSLFSFMLGIHFLITILLIILVLLQKTDSDGSLTSNQNTLNGTFSSHGHASFVVNATWVLAALFAINCLVLAKLAGRESSHRNALDIQHNTIHQPVQTPNDNAGSREKTQNNDIDTKAQQTSNTTKPSEVVDRSQRNKHTAKQKKNRNRRTSTSQNRTNKKKKTSTKSRTTKNYKDA